MTAAKRDPEATRTAILDAAESVFLARGFAEASTSKIARRAGVTKSLIHHHFGSKRDLWTAAKVRRFSRYAEAQHEMIATSTPDDTLLRRSMEFYFRYLQDNPEVLRMLAWMFLEGDEECDDVYSRLIRAGVEAISAGQETGTLRDDVAPQHILFGFLAMTQHWFQNRRHFMNEFCSPNGEAESKDQTPEQQDEAYMTDMLKIFFEGVVPR